MPSATTNSTPAHAAPTPSPTTAPPAVGRHRDRRAHERHAEDEQQQREEFDVVGDARRGRTHAADVATDDRDAARPLELVGELRAHMLERGGEHRPDVGDGQRQGVLVAQEQRPVHVADARPEQRRERRAGHDVSGDRLDDRPRGDQVAVVLEHDLVGDPLSDQRLHAVGAQRLGGAVGELDGVDQRVARVGGDEREQQDRRGHDDEPLSQQPAGPHRAHSRTVRHSGVGITVVQRMWGAAGARTVTGRSTHKERSSEDLRHRA
jgi:hypothetical protein